jgi:hypothetical protein
VAPPPLQKPLGAPASAPPPDLVSFSPFGRAPPGAARGAGAGALRNRAIIFTGGGAGFVRFLWPKAIC